MENTIKKIIAQGLDFYFEESTYKVQANYEINSEYITIVLCDDKGNKKNDVFVYGEYIERYIFKLMSQFKNYLRRLELEIVFNNGLDEAEEKQQDKLTTLKAIFKLWQEMDEPYYICIPYNLMGMLELKKVNKKSITCIDSCNNKVYLTEKILNDLYVKGDTIKVFC